MKEQKKELDSRYLKTKNKINEAMLTLLRNKKFDQISVKNICDTAKISRSAFYQHYKDKYDFVEKYQLELIERGNTLLIKKDAKITSTAFFLQLIKFLQSEGEILALLISHNGSLEIQDLVKKLFFENAKKNLLPYTNLPISSEIEAHYYDIYFSNAIFSVIQEWFNRNQTESPEELVFIIDKVIPFYFA